MVLALGCSESLRCQFNGVQASSETGCARNVSVGLQFQLPRDVAVILVSCRVGRDAIRGGLRSVRLADKAPCGDLRLWQGSEE